MPSVAIMSREAGTKRNPKQPSDTSKTMKNMAPAPHHLSEEFIQDSDDEALGSAEENVQNYPSRPGNNHSPSSKAGNLRKSPAVSISSDDSESLNESGDEDSGSSVEEEASETSQMIGNRSPRNQTAKAVSKPPPPYEPPHGFEAVSIGPTSKASRLFNGATLEGKQIWYFTAPSSVPISVVEEISLKAAMEGKSALEYKANDYRFVVDLAFDKTYTRVIVPDRNGNDFQTSIKFIDQVLHLQRIVKLPTAPFVANGQIGTVAPAKRPARQQPKGLKMRYHPIGFDRTDDNNAHLSEERGNGADSDKEIEDAPAFRRPEMLQGDDASDLDMTDLLPPPRVSNRQPRRGSKDSLKRKRKHDHGRVKNSISVNETGRRRRH